MTLKEAFEKQGLRVTNQHPLIDEWWENTSREYYYLNRKGVGVYDINDDVAVIDGKCEGYYRQELTWNGSKRIKVILEIELYDWDDEVKAYMTESAKVVGWEYE